MNALIGGSIPECYFRNRSIVRNGKHNRPVHNTICVHCSCSLGEIFAGGSGNSYAVIGAVRIIFLVNSECNFCMVVYVYAENCTTKVIGY